MVNATVIDNPPTWQTQVTLTHFLVKENDGLLSKDAQTLNGAQKQYQAKGVNHMIQGNHRNVRISLESIFDDLRQLPIPRR